MFLVGQPLTSRDVVELAGHAKRYGEGAVGIGGDCQFFAMPVYVGDGGSEQE